MLNNKPGSQSIILLCSLLKMIRVTLTWIGSNLWCRPR